MQGISRSWVKELLRTNISTSGFQFRVQHTTASSLLVQLTLNSLYIKAVATRSLKGKLKYHLERWSANLINSGIQTV